MSLVQNQKRVYALILIPIILISMFAPAGTVAAASSDAISEDGIKVPSHDGTDSDSEEDEFEGPPQGDLNVEIVDYSVEHIDGTEPSEMPTLDVRAAAGMLQVQLKNNNQNEPPEDFDGGPPENFTDEPPEDFDGEPPENFTDEPPEDFDGEFSGTTITEQAVNPYELSDIGVDESTRFRIEITTKDFNPSILIGSANDVSYKINENNDETKITIEASPIPVQKLSLSNGESPSLNNWPENERDQATQANDVEMILAIDGNGNATRSLFKEAYIATDAQSFSDPIFEGGQDKPPEDFDGEPPENFTDEPPEDFDGEPPENFTDEPPEDFQNDEPRDDAPKVPEQPAEGPRGDPDSDGETGELRIDVAGPHLTTNGEINEGFYTTKIPDSMLSTWGVSNASELTAAYKGETKNFDATPVEDGIVIEMDITYSSGTVSISPDANSSNSENPSDDKNETDRTNESDSASEDARSGPAGSPPTALASFSKTDTLTSQTSDLSGKLRAESGVADDITAELLRETASNYSLSLTAPDGTENVTFYLQSQAIESSQNIDNVSMYIDGSEENFYLDNNAGSGNSPWIAFQVGQFSTRTVSFASENTTDDSESNSEGDVRVSNAKLEPDTVNVSQTHTLSFTVSNVSADGTEDEINITMPDSINISAVTDARSTDTSYEVTIEDSSEKIALTVDPDESRETVSMDIEVTARLSANDG